jgi:hypothetical protein
MSWPQHAALLTTHEVGPKGGSCIVPATFRGTERKQSAGERIDLILLDSDSGATLEEIAEAIGRHGWAAAIASTHSHLSTITRAKRGAYEKWLTDAGIAISDPAGPTAYLIGFKGMLARIGEKARILGQDDTYVTFEHAPCPRYRIALPLARPWIAASFDTHKEAIAAWKGAYAAMAHALHLRHDASCADVSRLFYLPRRAAEAPPPETQILTGAWVDIFALPPASSPAERRRANGRAASKGSRSHTREGGTKAERASSDRRFGSRSDEPIEFTDPQTGETLDLVRWAAKSGAYFQLAKALQARRPDIFLGKVSDGVRHHITCPNAAAHTAPDPDHATFVTNAGQGENQGFVIHCRHDHCTDRDRLLMLRQMLEQGWLLIEDLRDPLFQPGAPPPKPTIRITAGEIGAVVDQAEDALLGADLGLYQRGPLLVRSGSVRVRTAGRHEVVARRIFEVGEHALVELMTRAAHWERYDGRTEDWVITDAPLRVAQTYRQRIGYWRLPVLTGLINGPTLRSDGSVLAQSGYDPATGLLLDTGGVRFPLVPERPCWEEGRAAASVLLQLIEQFPFAGETDRAVALSAILTACIRRSLPTAPLHGFSAPVMGSGKSKLVDIACLIATGREAAVMSQGKTEEEFEKRIGSLLLAGETVIPIDNCEAPLGGEFLCTVLTQTVARTRILGRSEAPELPTNAMITATGNNLVLVGDLTRRAVLCRLDPQCERPELRRFEMDPLVEIKADRPMFLVAALTVLRSYWAAGRPELPHAPLGSFEAWSRRVRDAIVWLGFEDPVATMDALRKSDPALDALSAVMNHWAAVIGERKVGAREIIEEAASMAPSTGGVFGAPRMEFRHSDFREALLAVAGDGGAINGRRLGKWLAAQQGRIVEGRRFCRIGLSGGSMQWQLQAVTSGQRDAA